MNEMIDYVNKLIENISNSYDEAYNFLLKCKEEYYNNEPIISDDLFDILESTFITAYPDSEYNKIVGTVVKGKKVEHVISMLSCDKGKTVEEVIKWRNKIKYNEALICMAKVDGLSGSIQYKNGEISCISTRGNGKFGENKTWLKDYLNIPKHIENFTGEVRGEIYINKSTEMITNNKPLRNIASGLVNRKDDKTDCEYLRFIAYQLYTDTNNEFLFNDLNDLEQMGFEVVWNYEILNDKAISDIRDIYLANLRNDFDYETDGLVFQVDQKDLYESIDSMYEKTKYHYYNFALKPPSENKQTKCLKKEWNVARSGDVVPVAIFNPVMLGGRQVERASLDNYSNVKNLTICENDIILVSLRNDVIPHVEEVITHIGTNLDIPTNCPSCNSKLSIITKSNNTKSKEPLVQYLHCTNLLCPDKNIKQITFWCECFEFDGVSESTIRTLYNNKLIYEIKDLYTLKDSYDTLLTIEGFGTKKIDNLLNQIESTKSISIEKFVKALGIELVGERATKNLGITTITDFWNFNDSTYVIGQNLIEFRDNNKEVIEHLLSIISIKENKMNTETIKGYVAMTGKGMKTRNELIEDIKTMGYAFTESVTKETTILICEDINGDSSKLVSARKKGITLMSYEEFFK